MAALTALAIAGVAAAGYGAYNSYEGNQKAQAGYQQAQQGAAIQAEAARQQAGIYKEQAASSVEYAGKERDLNILAAQQSAQAASQSRDINQNVINQQMQISELQRRAMELDARRGNMEIIRNQQRARAVSIATGVSQGGSGFLGGSSARGGAYGQISGQSNVNLMGIQQNLSMGRANFAANQSISQSRLQMSDLETQYAIQQAQNQTTKSNIMYDYAKVGAAYQTRLADTQTLMAQGQGMVSQGQGYAQMGQSQMQMGSSFMQAGQNLFSFGMNTSKLFPMTSSFSNPFNSTGSFY